MTKSSSNLRLHLPEDISNYIQSGEHAFIACDDSDRRNAFVRSLQDNLADSPVGYIDGNYALKLRDFAVAIVESCHRLIGALGVSVKQRDLSIANSLDEAMQVFDATGHQGFLIIDNIDPVIEMQRTIEIEGPLRSVMQLHDDVAVVLCGTNKVINDMVGNYERPFYMSFRVFRL